MNEQVDFLRNALNGLSISGYELEHENLLPYFSNHLRKFSQDACKWLVDDEDDSNEKILFAKHYEDILSENGYNDITKDYFKKCFALPFDEEKKQVLMKLHDEKPRQFSKYYAAFVLTFIEQFLFLFNEDGYFPTFLILEIHLAFKEINRMQPTAAQNAKRSATAKFDKYYGAKKESIRNWYKENKSGFKSMDNMAEAAAKKFDMPFKTARNWIGDYNKELKLLKEFGIEPQWARNTPLRAEGILSIKYVFRIPYRTHLDGLDTYEHINENILFQNPLRH